MTFSTQTACGLAQIEQRDKLQQESLLMTLNKRFCTVDFCAFLELCTLHCTWSVCQRYNDTSAPRHWGSKAACKEQQQPAEVKRSTIDCVLAIRLAAAAVLFVAHNQLVSFYCQRRHRTTLRHRLVLVLPLSLPSCLPPHLICCMAVVVLVD